MKIRKTSLSDSSFENNWKSKTLEALEKDYWPDLEEPNSYLITTCRALRKKQLHTFTVEDLKIMIGQSIGLKYLVPLAIEKLEIDILAEGDYYEADLLKSILTSDQNYWRQEKGNWSKICNLVDENFQRIKTEAYQNKIYRKIIDSYRAFEDINR